MASIAELLISGTQEATKETGRRSQQSIQSAAELGLKQEQLAANKAAVAQKKEELVFKRLGMASDDIKFAQTLPPKMRDPYIKNFLPNKWQAAGIGPDVINPTVAEMMFKDADQTAIAIGEAVLQQQEGKLTASDMKRFAADPQFFAELMPQLVTAQSERLGREAKVEAAQLTQAGQTARKERGIEAAEEAKTKELERTAQKKAKDVLGAEFGKFKAAGGESALRTRIRKIGVVVDALRKREIKTGSFLQSLPLTGGTAADKVFRKKFREAQGNIKGAINIKQILDSQFGDRAMLEAQENLGIDGALETDQNINKLEELQRSMLEELDNKVDAFQSEGLLDGKKKKEAPKSKFQSLTPSQQKLLVSRRAKKLKISEAEAKKQLEGL